MKKIHYQNVGFPRSGTTWLWQSLVAHPEIFKANNFVHLLKTKNFVSENKEPKFKEWTSEVIENRIPKDVTPIIEKYKEYDISLAFNTFDFLCSPEEISQIEEYTTHVSLIIRNPFEVVSNYYAYSRITLPQDKKDLFTVDYLINLFDFSNTVGRWLTFKNKFKIFVYDDLLNDQTAFYKEVCKFIDVEPNKDVIEKVNSILYYTESYQPINFTDQQTEILNNHIENLGKLINRDFTHWKK